MAPKGGGPSTLDQYKFYFQKRQYTATPRFDVDADPVDPTPRTAAKGRSLEQEVKALKANLRAREQELEQFQAKARPQSAGAVPVTRAPAQPKRPMSAVDGRKQLKDFSSYFATSLLGQDDDEGFAAPPKKAVQKKPGHPETLDFLPEVDYPPKGLAESVKKLPEWQQLGCGDKPYYCKEKNAVFPSDQLPKELPDLSKHNNCMAEFLQKNPEVFHALKTRVTSTGVNLAQCIKTGVDNLGEPGYRTVGLTAGDEESYTVFKELFDPVISARHSGYAAGAVQPTDLDISKISNIDIDPWGKYVLTTRVRTGRSVRGFKLPSTISFADRRRLEEVCVSALRSLTGDLAGEYLPLRGSRSYAAKPDGMSKEEERSLREMGNLFEEPNSTILLASGMGRHWPDGRGVFRNKQRTLFVWVGEEDHLRIVSMQGSRSRPTPEGKDIKEVFSRFIRACDQVQRRSSSRIGDSKIRCDSSASLRQ
jgi:creatine kinase